MLPQTIIVVITKGPFLKGALIRPNELFIDRKRAIKGFFILIYVLFRVGKALTLNCS